MIQGNAYSTYVATFDNGEEFSLMATSEIMASSMAASINPYASIISIQEANEWADGND